MKKETYCMSGEGLWDFAFLGNIDLETADPLGAVFSEKMPVPGAFDALPAYAGKLGLAVYRKQFHVPVGRRARLEFGAVSRWSRVYVDQAVVVENACAYAPFDADLPVADHPVREVVVMVDNRFDFERAPLNLEYFDYYQYGGIIRNLHLKVLPEEEVWIDTVQVTPHPDKYRDGWVEIRVALDGRVERIGGISWQFDGSTESFHRKLEESDRGVVRFQSRVPDAGLWSPSHPELHSLHVKCYGENGQDVDEKTVRFGLRRIEARQGHLFLNGELLQLRGYCRHEWHPNYGPSTPVLQMAADLQILKDMGCNFIRGGHYPQSQQFLDLCDELGFLVWEEMNGGVPKANYVTPKFLADHDRALRAMVRASYNHPSVIIWAFLNESASDQDFSRPVYEKIVHTLRELDGSRLVTYASNKAMTDKHLDLVDIISLNLYPGWYGCEAVENPLELVVPRLRECLDFYSAPQWKDKPVIVSEIGAEAIYGWRDPHNDFFTEEYQAELLRRACSEMLDNPRSSGLALWQFCDVRTWSGCSSLGRPRTFNNKGSFDEYRRPKAAAKVVREIYRAHADASLRTKK